MRTITTVFIAVLYFTMLIPPHVFSQTVGIRINGGKKYANDPNVFFETRSLKLSSTMISEMKYGFQSDLSDSNWQPFTTEKIQIKLLGDDGEKKLYIQLKDKAGNMSPIEFQRIILDTKPPVNCSITINNHEEYTNDKLGRALIEPQHEGAYTIRMANNEKGLATAKWEPIQPKIKWQIDYSGVEGERTVYAQFADEAENISETVKASIIFDITPPNNAELIINNGEKFIKNPKVKLRFKANDVDMIRIASVNKAENMNFQANSADGWMTIDWELDTLQGKKEVRVYYMDKAKNKAEQPVIAETIYDTRGPLPPKVAINNNDKFTNDPDGRVNLKIITPENPNEISMLISNNKEIDQNKIVPFKNTYSWQLDSKEDGLKNIFVYLVDEAKNLSNPEIGTIILDRTPPKVISFKINDGNEWATSNRVNLNFEVEEASMFQVSNNNDLNNYTAWEKYKPLRPDWLLSPGNNPRVVYVRFKDDAGNMSETVTSQINIDNKIPKGGIEINKDQKYTNDENGFVTLDITYDSDVMGTQISNEPDFTKAKLLPIQSKIEKWKLSDGDGLKTIYARFQDKAGNFSEVTTARIFLDRTPPSNCEVAINNNDEWLTNPSKKVALSFNVEDAAAMMISNQPDFNNAEWIPFKTAVSWVLEGEEGKHIVYAKFKDIAGNVSKTCHDEIKSDFSPPVVKAFKIDNDNLYTNNSQKQVTLTINVEGATSMIISNDPIVHTSEDIITWQPYESSKEWILSNEDGLKTVYARFRDNAGNTTPLMNSKIYLDRIPPSKITLLINNGDKYTNNKEFKVKLNITSEDASKIMLSNDLSFKNASWQKFEHEIENWELPKAQGEHTVYLKAMDAAGNISDAVEAKIICDTDPPTSPSITINDGAKYVSKPEDQIKLKFSVKGASYIRIGAQPDLSGKKWEPYQEEVLVPSFTKEGEQKIFVQFADDAGNISELAEASIILDTSAPEIKEFLIDNGADWSNDKDKLVNLKIKSTEASEMRICANPNFENCNWQKFSPTIDKYQLVGDDGEKILYLQLKDEVGNISRTATATINLKRAY